MGYFLWTAHTSNFCLLEKICPKSLVKYWNVCYISLNHPVARFLKFRSSDISYKEYASCSTMEIGLTIRECGDYYSLACQRKSKRKNTRMMRKSEKYANC